MFFSSINCVTVRFELISGYFSIHTREFFSRDHLYFFDTIARRRSGNSYLQSLNEIPTHRAVLQLRRGSLVGYSSEKRRKTEQKNKAGKGPIPCNVRVEYRRVRSLALRKLTVRGADKIAENSVAYLQTQQIYPACTHGCTETAGLER